jgi:hypothetical protein
VFTVFLLNVTVVSKKEADYPMLMWKNFTERWSYVKSFLSLQLKSTKNSEEYKLSHVVEFYRAVKRDDAEQSHDPFAEHTFGRGWVDIQQSQLSRGKKARRTSTNARRFHHDVSSSGKILLSFRFASAAAQNEN